MNKTFLKFLGCFALGFCVAFAAFAFHFHWTLGRPGILSEGLIIGIAAAIASKLEWIIVRYFSKTVKLGVAVGLFFGSSAQTAVHSANWFDMLVCAVCGALLAFITIVLSEMTVKSIAAEYRTAPT